MSPCEFTAIKTFLVTPGAQRGRHLKINEEMVTLPDVCGGHLFFKIFIENVAGLLGEDVENFDASVAHRGGNVFIIVVVTNAESRHLGITECVLVRNLSSATRACLRAYQD